MDVGKFIVVIKWKIWGYSSGPRALSILQFDPWHGMNPRSIAGSDPGPQYYRTWPKVKENQWCLIGIYKHNLDSKALLDIKCSLSNDQTLHLLKILKLELLNPNGIICLIYETNKLVALPTVKHAYKNNISKIQEK